LFKKSQRRNRASDFPQRPLLNEISLSKTALYRPIKVQA
jgi:hypothetical protein